MWKPITYSNEHLLEMLKMTRENYGADNDITKRDFIEHQYFENPAGDAVIDLAWDDHKQQLAGQYVVWPMRFWVQNKLQLCAHSLNTLTRTDYRGQGIFTGLAERTYAREITLGHGFCYGTPNPNSYSGFINKLVFSEIGQTPLYLRPLNPATMLKEFLGHKWLSSLAKPLNIFWKVNKIKEKGNIKIVCVTEKNLALVDSLWNKICGKYPVMNIRDSLYVKFRYLNMPHRIYYPYLVLRGGVPVAFAVGRIMNVAGMQCGMLADFMFAVGCEAQAKILLSFMLRLLQTKGASVAGSLMLAHTQEAAILRKCGFLRCPKKLEPQPFPLIVRLFDESLKEKGVLDIQNWFFTMGDYDVI